MSKIQVALEDGSLVMCQVMERTYNHDVGARTALVKHDGNEFMAVHRFGAWRKWTPRDRVQPLIDHIERCAKTGERPFKPVSFQNLELGSCMFSYAICARS